MSTTNTNLATVEPIDKAPKKSRKPRKSPARGAAKAVQPSPVEAMQVLAYRGQLGGVEPLPEWRQVIASVVASNAGGDFPPAIKAGLAKGLPGLVAAVDATEEELGDIMNGVA